MSTISLIDQDPIWSVLLRFLVTLLVLTIIIRFIYFRYSRKERTVFSFFLMGIMIFFVCILLQHVEIQLGVALGLFAIFAILRFRSEGLSLREMTYFFTVIGVSVINAMATYYNPLRGTILINSLIIISVLVLEVLFHTNTQKRASLTYDRLDLLDETRTSELLADISARTFKKVERVNLKKVDLNKGTAELDIYFSSINNRQDKQYLKN